MTEDEVRALVETREQGDEKFRASCEVRCTELRVVSKKPKVWAAYLQTVPLDGGPPLDGPQTVYVDDRNGEYVEPPPNLWARPR